MITTRLDVFALYIDNLLFIKKKQKNNRCGGRCGRDRMVIGFTTTCVTSAYHH
jgi:hypothetical protein